MIMAACRLLAFRATVSIIIFFVWNNVEHAAQFVAKDVHRLEADKAVGREISEGETHSYRVRLEAGEFIHIFIYQRGMNVMATLFALDGNKLLETDVPRSTQEAEWITHVAAAAGEYRIEVRGVDKGAPPGRYEIKLEEKHRSAAGDETRLLAQLAFADGSKLFSEKNYGGALEKYQQALGLYRNTGRQVEQAVTLNCIARSNVWIGDYQKAIERYKEALPIYHELSDAHGEGITLHEMGSAHLSLGHSDEALGYFERALDSRRRVGYRAGEGLTLYNLGSTYIMLKQYEKGIEHYERALEIAHDVKNRTVEAVTLNSLGIVYSNLSRYEKAIEWFEQALAIYREVKDRTWEGRILGNIGLANNFLSRYEKAIENYQQALAISRELKDRAGESRALGNLGKAYSDLNRYEKAIEYLEQSLVICREAKDREGEGIALNNIGSAYNNLSQHEKAIEYLKQALISSREAKDRLNEVRTLNNIGNSNYQLSQYERAIEYYTQALELRREIKDRKGEGLTLNNLGLTYRILGRYEKAIEHFGQALAIARDVKDRAGEGSCLNQLGFTYTSLSRYEKAIEYHQQALTISQEVKGRGLEGASLQGLGSAHDSLARYEKATEYYEQSLAIFRELKIRSSEGTLLNALMLVWERQNNNPVAIFNGKQAVNVFQEIRGNIKSLDRESQQSYLKNKEAAYRKLADLLISEGRLPEAEEVIALLKEEEYSKIVRRDGPMSPGIGFNGTEAEGARISEQLALLARQRGAVYARLEGKTATDSDRLRLTEIDEEIKVANAQFRLAMAEIIKSPPIDARALEAAKQSQSLMPDLRKLGQGTVALYTVITKEKGWIMMVTADSRKAYSLDTNGLEQTVAQLREALKTDRYDPVPVAQKLYRMIIAAPQKQGKTLAEDLHTYGAKTLMWSLDGVLRYVPVAVLHDGKNYLVEKYTNVVFTTASISRLNAAASNRWRGLGLGVSKQYGRFPALEGVERELRSIISEEGSPKRTGVLDGQIKMNEAFNKKAMIDGLQRGFPVVLIASHFSFNTTNEAQSYLLLGDGNGLTLEELQDYQNIFEKVELLTLSACDTAVGGSNGKEVEGLAYLSQSLGAKAVVASLWPVSDAGAEVLMREFYYVRMKQPKFKKAEAFQLAQIDLLRGKEKSLGAKERQARSRGPQVVTGENDGLMPYRKNSSAPFGHPHYWAPFILIGNWK
jgi:CHAT domain-containing protein/uncharacterized protein HemY